METIFLHYLDAWAPLIYILIFAGMFFEGDIIIFLSFYLAHQGDLNVFIVIPVVVSGVILGNFCWYKFGIYPDKWFPYLKRKLEKLSAILDDRINKNLFRTFLVTKFTYNFHHVTLMRAGAIKIPFKKYFKADILSSLVWIAIIGGFGYASSLSFILFKKTLKFAEVGLLIGLAIFFILIKLFSTAAKKRARKFYEKYTKLNQE